MANFVKFDAVLMSKWDSLLLDGNNNSVVFPYTKEVYIQPENVTRIHQSTVAVASVIGDYTEICMADGYSFVVEMPESDVIIKLS